MAKAKKKATADASKVQGTFLKDIIPTHVISDRIQPAQRETPPELSWQPLQGERVYRYVGEHIGFDGKPCDDTESSTRQWRKHMQENEFVIVAEYHGFCSVREVGSGRYWQWIQVSHLKLEHE